jgi:hypothetical protein
VRDIVAWAGESNAGNEGTLGDAGSELMSKYFLQPTIPASSTIKQIIFINFFMLYLFKH